MTRLIGNRVEQCLNIADLRRAAARRAHRMVFDYIDGGADDEWTLTGRNGDKLCPALSLRTCRRR